MSYAISINGKKLDSSRMECIESISIDEQCDGSDTLTFAVNDPDFLFIADNIFIEEATVYAEIWWLGETYKVKFEGFISAIDIDFPESGFPTLNIFCLDNSHLMNRKKKKRSWDNVTSAQVVQIIAKEYGYSAKIESGYTFKKEDTITQSDSTDIAFLESLAGNERDLFMCKLIGNTIHYVKKGLLQTPSATVKYREHPQSVISFSPKINKETRQEEIEVADVNTNTKKVDKAVATTNNTAREVQGEPVKTTSSPTSSSSENKSGYKYDPKTKTWLKV